MWESIVNAFKSFLQRVKNFFRKIINGILDFARDVLAFFKGLKLRIGKHLPWLAKGEEFSDLAKSEEFKEMLHNAPVKKVGVYTGVYNEETDEIENVQEIQADALDEKTKAILGNDKLVVLN